MGLPLKLLLVSTLFAAGCVTDCRQRAEQSHRECMNPTWYREGDAQKVTTSDEQQACRDRYQQALSRCSGGTPATKTSTISDPLKFD